MSAPAISIQGLVKRYGRLTAVSNLSLEVSEGEIFGFLGLNGAGKTTTIRILLDLLRPNSGTATVMGHDCRRSGLKVRELVGYLPGEVDLYGDLTGREILDLFARLHRRPVSQQGRHELQRRLGLPEADTRRKIREYSTGMRRKLGLILAFQGDAPLLILDEPTEGLDPLMQESFYDLLSEVRRRGRTVFMSSHVLSEVERVCDRIGLIRMGELALLSSVEDLHKMAHRKVRVTFQSDVAGPTDMPPGYEVLEIMPRAWNVRIQGALGPLMTALSGLPVLDVDVAEPRLEEVLMRYYREENQ